MTDAPLEPFAVLELPRDGDLPDARLRLLSALITIPFSFLLLFVDNGVVRAFGAAGFAASAFWLWSARATFRQAREAERRALVLAPDRIALVEGPRETSALAWSDVRSLEIDDARDAIVVADGGARELVVRPGYGHLGLEPLLVRIDAARRASASGLEHGARTPDRG